MDYGHDLLFGSFIGPRAADADEVVALAELSEEVGLDLVTFQDHPYQPAFLDTWTLLSYVAARTERIRLSANVLNAPLRPPAVLGPGDPGHVGDPARPGTARVDGHSGLDLQLLAAADILHARAGDRVRRATDVDRLVVGEDSRAPLLGTVLCD